jgi:hypothetical protein
LERAWTNEPGRFEEAEEVRLTVADYGARYRGSKVSVMSKADVPGHWIVKSHRRKSPMTVADEHLEKKAA